MIVSSSVRIDYYIHLLHTSGDSDTLIGANHEIRTDSTGRVICTSESFVSFKGTSTCNAIEDKYFNTSNFFLTKPFTDIVIRLITRGTMSRSRRHLEGNRHHSRCLLLFGLLTIEVIRRASCERSYAEAEDKGSSKEILFHN